MSILISYPQWLDPESWAAFVDMRRTVKKPLTTYAAKLLIYELNRIKDAGHCPNAALHQSIMHCWADVYVPKEKPIEASSSNAADETAKYLADLAEHRRASVRRVR